MTMQLNTPIQPCLWFNNQAEEAARFYTSVFPRSRMGTLTHCGAHGPCWLFSQRSTPLPNNASWPP